MSARLSSGQITAVNCYSCGLWAVYFMHAGACNRLLFTSSIRSAMLGEVVVLASVTD